MCTLLIRRVHLLIILSTLPSASGSDISINSYEEIITENESLDSNIKQHCQAQGTSSKSLHHGWFATDTDTVLRDGCYLLFVRVFLAMFCVVWSVVGDLLCVVVISMGAVTHSTI